MRTRDTWRNAVIANFVFCCFFYVSVAAANYNIISLFTNPKMQSIVVVNRTQSQSESTTSALSTPSQIPPSAAPFASTRSDDWYFAYQPRRHKISSQNDADKSAVVSNDESGNTYDDDNDCFDRDDTGGRGRPGCRGKMTKNKEGGMRMKRNDKPQMMMNQMGKSRAPKANAVKCANGKGSNLCSESDVPSTVPSGVPLSASEAPKNLPTSDPKTAKTSSPSITTVPSSSLNPTFTSMPSEVVLPTEYPTFDTTLLESPSLPPNLMVPTNSPVAKVKTSAPLTTQTQQPTLVPTITPSLLIVERPSPSLIPIVDDAFLRRATPFVLSYKTMNTNESNNVGADDAIGGDNDSIINNSTTTPLTITMEHILEVQEITMDFVVDYLDEQFFGNTETIVDYYISNVITNEKNDTNPVSPSIPYTFGIVFANSSTFILSNEEIDVLMESAFIKPFVDVLIFTLQELSTTNPFTSTSSIVYTQQIDVDFLNGGRTNNGTNTTFQDSSRPTDEGGKPTNETSANVLFDEKSNQTSPPIRIDENIQNFDAIISQYEKSTVKVTPFSLKYQLISHNDSNNSDLQPSISETKAASNITLTFLDHYVHTMFDLGQPGALTYFVGYSAGMIYEPNVIDFRTGLQFQDTSMFTSIQDEIDMIIQTAFIPHYVEPLIQELRSKLPSSNPFSKTISISFESNAYAEPLSQKEVSTLGIVALMTAVLLVAILFILIVLYRYRTRYRKRRRNVSGVPKIVIHANHDPIHGDLIEIISSDDPDENDRDSKHHIDGFSSIFSFVHQRLTIPLSTIDDIGETTNDDSSSSVGSKQYKTTRRSTKSTTKQISDGWSSTSSSSTTSALSFPASIIPLKYTEPRIFEEVD